jgi:hypothetical protein
MKVEIEKDIQTSYAHMSLSILCLLFVDEKLSNKYNLFARCMLCEFNDITARLL